MIKINRRTWELVIVVIVFLVLFLLLLKYRYIFDNKEQIRIFMESLGIIGPLVLILLQMVQVIIPFIPGGIITLSGGYVFGTYLGTLYSVIGMVLGSLIVFTISKKLGRPFVEKIIDKKEIKRVDKFIKKHGESSLFFSRIMPFFPHDIISYAVGLTSISRRKFLIATTLGFLPHSFVHNYIGDSIYRGVFDFKFYLLLTVIVILGISYLFRRQIKIFLLKKKRSKN